MAKIWCQKGKLDLGRAIYRFKKFMEGIHRYLKSLEPMEIGNKPWQRKSVKTNFYKVNHNQYIENQCVLIFYWTIKSTATHPMI